MSLMMSDHASERAHIEAPPELCYSAVLDVERYPEWVRDIKEARILLWDDEGRAGDVQFRAAAIGRSTSYTLRYSYGSNPLRVSWNLIEGDIVSRMVGRYEFENVPHNPQLTEVYYDLDVDLKVNLPGFLRRRVEVKIVHAAIDDLRFRIESLAASH